MQDNPGRPESRHDDAFDSSIELQHQNFGERGSIHSATQPQDDTNIILQEDVPPNGGYAWVCTACVFLINAHTWGVNGAWGVILNYFLERDSFPGAGHLEYALIGGLSISQALMVSPIAGTSRQKLGTRNTLLIGTAVVFLALFTSSYATKIWHLFLSQGVCFGWGMGFLYITATAVLPPWFSTHRSLAVGLSTSGAGLGGLAYSLGAGHGIQVVGIAWTYRILALCSVVVNLLSSILLKDRIQPHLHAPPPPQHPQHAPRAKSRLRAFNLRDLSRVEVLLIVFWGVVTELGYITLYYSLPNFASTIGLSASQGAVANALLNLGLGVGRPIVGYYSDVLGRINMAMLMTALCGVLCLALWIPAHSYGVLVAFAVLSGMVCGTFWSTIAPVLAEVVGIADLASVFGLICFALVLPTTFAEPIAMQLVNSAGLGEGVRKYLVAQIFVSAMFILGAASLWMLRSWKIFEIERKAALERAEGMLNPEARSTVSRRMENFWLTPRRLFLPRRV
ncbi:putative transporter ESBP6 [Botryosphaeria dothidea]|uniref:Transporter ESBP6 n=1 Tax=Botryosphaeria dothidea TaxID=55169 RepID=A0A8H4N3Y0_9PEZI|nr:putative transporter ESBP6 [Botryosphaeria dothidea]